MDHIKYSNKYTANPTGLQNTGVICYFNSLIQSLLSCTSLNQYFINEPATYTNKEGQPTKHNKVWIMYQQMIVDMVKSTGSSDWSVKLWTVLIEHLRSTNKYPKFGHGQEDGHEGFHLLIDALEDKKVVKLFEHRFRSIIGCVSCKKICIKTVDEAIAIPIHESELKSTELESYLKDHKPEIDSDFICKHCKKKGDKTQMCELTMVPEILVLQFKKFNQKSIIDFPQQLQFNSSGEVPIIYQLVSQMEHSGSTSGGHYWAISLRRDGVIYNFNDNSMAKSMWQPTTETYVAFYHIL